MPGLTDGITNNFVNSHISFSGWAGWLSQFLASSLDPVGLYGTYAGGGRMVITGPDNNFHAVRGSGNAAQLNQYNLIVNELRWVTALQVPEPGSIVLWALAAAALFVASRGKVSPRTARPTL